MSQGTFHRGAALDRCRGALTTSRAALVISGNPRAAQRQSAFTLIEMMVVMAVIAILLGVLLPQFRGAQDEASIQRSRAELRTTATAIESYYIHNSNALPAALSNLTSATPRIISSVPNDPFRASGTADSYATDTNGVYYVVWSYGPNRAAAITAISTAGAVQCGGSACATSIDDVCVTNGTPVGASNC